MTREAAEMAEQELTMAETRAHDPARGTTGTATDEGVAAPRLRTAEPPEWLRPAPPGELRTGLWPVTASLDATGVLTVGGLRATELAERFGTPLYVFDETDFLQRCDEFRAAFTDFDIYYAGKAFLCKAVARMVAQAGLRLDVCSGGELAVALAAGVPPELILMHGNNKSPDELDHAIRNGVGRIVIDSTEEIDGLCALAAVHRRRPHVLLRVTVGVTAQTHEHIATAHDDQKFGFSISSGAAAEAAGRILRSGRLELLGLHSHIGSQIFATAGFELAARRAVGLQAALRAEHGVDLPELSVGGGFGIAYTCADQPASPAELARRLRTAVTGECRRLGAPVPRLAIEPGRALVGRAGCTLYRVGAVKHLEGLRTYVAVDGGMSDNVRPALYGGLYSAQLADRVSHAEPVLARVVGKHCDAGDIVVRDDFLPGDICAGDLLAVPGTGAYCRSLAHNYNHVPRPPVVAVRHGSARVIVRGETHDDLLRLDVG